MGAARHSPPSSQLALSAVRQNSVATPFGSLRSAHVGSMDATERVATSSQLTNSTSGERS